MLCNKYYSLATIDDDKTLYSGCSILTHKNSNKKALVIYGYDHNGFSKGNTAEVNLFYKGYDVLVIDARNQYISLSSLPKIIQETNYFNLDLIYLNMHGNRGYFISDTILNLNKQSAYVKVAASELFKIIMRTINNVPIKVIIVSCHSQLFSHKALNILPNKSEILMLGEDQKIDTKEYIFNSYRSYALKFNEILLEQKDLNLRKIIAKSHYYHNNLHVHEEQPDYGFFHPSHTYGMIGRCNFRTPVNFSKKDLKELLLKTTKFEVISEVTEYLNEQNKEEDIKEYLDKFFEKIESTDDNHPLLKYRENTIFNSDFHKYLGISSALYGLYDQCGKGYIQDSNVLANEDAFISSEIMYPLYKNSQSILYEYGFYNIASWLKSLPYNSFGYNEF